MIRIAALVLLSLSLVFSVGCVVPIQFAGHHKAPIRPQTGALLTSYKAPLTTDFNDTPVDCPKTGKSVAHFLHLPYLMALFPVAWGDASIEAAAERGQIQKVAYAEYEYLNVLGVYSQYTTLAHGN